MRQILAPVERQPDLSLVRMNPKQHREAVALIKKRCSNYNGDACLRLDAPCAQCLSASVCCGFFRHVVLKENPVLEAELFHSAAIKTCERCSKPFASAAHNARYCPNCRVSVQREHSRNSVRKKRSDV